MLLTKLIQASYSPSTVASVIPVQKLAQEAQKNVTKKTAMIGMDCEDVDSREEPNLSTSAHAVTGSAVNEQQRRS